jgi:hypothetical protein
MRRLALLAVATFATGCVGEVESWSPADGAPSIDGSIDPPTSDAARRDDGGSVGSDGAASTDAGGADALPDPGGAPTGLDAYPAHASVGLDWDVAPGAESYNLYWSTTPGVTPSSGALLADVTPGHVHRALTDGTTYHYVVTALVAGVEGPPSAEASATPGGELMLHTLGTGVIDAIASEGEIALPIDRRIHVLVLPEGYLASELGTFATDVDALYDEVFALDPYSLLADAFVVWYLPRASAEHVAPGSPQPADTAFLVPITSDGAGIASVPTTGPTATRVWGVVDTFAHAPTEHYPAGGRTSGIAKGVVAHLLVYDAARGRSGLSGRAMRLVDPASSSRAIGTAIAHGRAHELSHALARLVDEYLDVALTGLGAPSATTYTSSGVSNVASDDACTTLPWRHLLVGGDINPDVDQLVGAFGTAEIGYHSELRCQMNGSHDNGMFYGGDDNLRVARFCNFCRELLTFRVLEHTRTLPDPGTSWSTWEGEYRTPFYDRYGFSVPAVVPQENSLGEPRFEGCR